MSNKGVFLVVKLDDNSWKEEKMVYFTTEEVAISFISKYLNGLGYVQFRDIHARKVYRTLEEYENDLECGQYLV